MTQLEKPDGLDDLVIEFAITVEGGTPDRKLGERTAATMETWYEATADMQLRQGRFAEAIPRYEAMLEMGEFIGGFAALLGRNGPKFTANLLYNLGCCYKETGEREKAMGLWQEALGQEEMTELLRGHLQYNLGTELAHDGRFEEAREHLMAARQTPLCNDARTQQNLVYVNRQLARQREGRRPRQTLGEAQALKRRLYGQTPCG